MDSIVREEPQTLTIPPARVFEGKKIFVAPLDWGLGHASRCVPLIRQLLSKNEVILGTTPVTSPLLTRYFPSLRQVELPSYKVRYSKRVPAWMGLVGRLPFLFSVARKEKEATSRYVEELKINVIISDNRYGVHHPLTINIFICHQINLRLPFLSGTISSLHRMMFRPFSEVWIPDYKETQKRLGGELSDAGSLKHRHRYLGPISALQAPATELGDRFDYLILLSGPEPNRSDLEKRLLKVLKGSNKSIALVRGTNLPSENFGGLIHVRDLCTGEELASLIKNSGTVICRSGYSTLMDLYLLGKKEIILIPTSGQPEQEYLARHWSMAFGAKVLMEDNLKDDDF